MILLSSGAFSEPDITAMAAECVGLGVGLEFTSNLAPRAGLVDEVLRLKATGLPTYAHNYFPPPAEPFVLNLAATDAGIRAASHALCRTGIDLNAALGAPFYSVHAGFAMNLRADQLGQPEQQAALAAPQRIDRGVAEQAFRESVREISAYAKARGVRLLLENNVITQTQVAAGRGDSLLLTMPSECRTFFDELVDPNVGLLLDVAHARVSAGALRFEAAEFFALGAHLQALHLSDNDGLRDNNQPFAHDAWFAPHLAAVRDLPMVIEVYRLDAAGRARQIEILRSLLA
jgi:sugar phosphate isomerase/epimerase